MLAAVITPAHIVLGFSDHDLANLDAGRWTTVGVFQNATLVVCHDRDVPDTRNFISLVPPIVLLAISDSCVTRIRDERKSVMIDARIPGVGEISFKCFWQSTQEELIASICESFPEIQRYRPDTLPKEDHPI